MKQVRGRGATILFVSHATAAVREICTRVIVLEAGHLVFDGGVDEGLTHYARLMASGHAAVLPGAASRAGVHDAATPRLHRRAMSAHWEALGPWAVGLLRAEGLDATRSLLDLGCGSLPVALHVLPLMAPGRYWGIDTDRELLDAGVREELAPAGVLPDRGHFLIDPAFDLAACPHRFHLALAHSLAARATPAAFGRALGAVLDHLEQGGRLLVVVPETSVDHVEAMTGVLARGIDIQRIENAGHPGGDTVYRLTRKAAGV
jgi:SAM-dependent methyltransferase